MTFIVNGKKCRVETAPLFSIDGDVGSEILQWKRAPRGKVTIACVCSGGIKARATGVIMK